MAVGLDEELTELRRKLLAMANTAEDVVRRAVLSLDTRDDSMARRVQEDDNILDAFEKQMDESGIGLLGSEPDLATIRLILVSMKVARDLERIGDEATTISRQVIELNALPRQELKIDVTPMADLGLQMLREALTTFVERDSQRARAIVPRDKEIDAMNKRLQSELAGLMTESPSNIPHGLPFSVICKSLERIGDHATNIAEETVHLYDGRSIRHDPGVKNAAPTSPAV
jgi:phosphate transport system protein